MKTIISVSIVLSFLALTSCGGADCSCDEIVKNDGKYYQSGIHKNGDHVKFGELFTGICETLDAENETLEIGEYNNGMRVKHQLWAEFNGEYIQGKDMSYKNNKPFNGWKKGVKGDNSLNIRYVSDFIEYEQGKIKTEWNVEIYYNEIMIRFTRDNFELDGSNHFENCNTQMSTFHAGEPVGQPLVKFINCIKNKKISGFEYWGDLPNSTESSGDNEISDKPKAINSELETNELIDESVINSDVEQIAYYKINDPDGYSNLRSSPGGDIIKKVYEDELFEVIGEKDNHKKVKLTDGTVGYIHDSRVTKKNN